MKRIQCDFAASSAPPPMNEATNPTDNSAITPTTEQTITRPSGSTPVPPILNLLTIQAELFVYILKNLPAEEIIRFQVVAKPFYEVLTKDLQANALLRRNQFIMRWKCYDEKSKTLDLTEGIKVFSRFLLESLQTTFGSPDIRYLVRTPVALVSSKHQEFLNEALGLFRQQPNWAAAHIHTLIVPIQTGFCLHGFSDTMAQLAILLPGVKEITLAVCSEHFYPETVNASVDQNKLMRYLEAFKKIPVEKVIIPINSFSPSPALLCQAINEGCLSEKITELVLSYHFDDRPGSEIFFNFPILKDNGFYPNLVRLSLYTENGLDYYYTINLGVLPSTITHLHMNTQVVINGQTRSIKNLHITDQGNGNQEDYEIFENLDTLPALEKIHIVPHRVTEMHSLILSALARAPSRPISIEFPTLHLSPPSLLARVREKFTNGVSIQDTLSVHIASSEHLQDFITLAQQGSFVNLPHIEFASDLLTSHFYLPFVESIQSLLQLGVLPRLTKLTLTYQYNPRVPPEEPWIPPGFFSKQQLLLNPEIKYFALMAQPTFSLQQLLSGEGLNLLQKSFISIEPEIKKLMQKQYISADKQDHFFNTLYQKFDAFLATYSSAEQTVTYNRGMSVLEEIHNNLYFIYFNSLKQFILERSQEIANISSSELMWWERGFVHYQQCLPNSFQETKLEKKVLLRANQLILGAFVDSLCSQIQPLLPEFALSSPTSEKSPVLTENGFTIDFYKRPEEAERQKKRKFSLVEEIPTHTTSASKAS
jgi:hypothetical protein